MGWFNDITDLLSGAVEQIGQAGERIYSTWEEWDARLHGGPAAEEPAPAAPVAVPAAPPAAAGLDQNTVLLIVGAIAIVLLLK